MLKKANSLGLKQLLSKSICHFTIWLFQRQSLLSCLWIVPSCLSAIPPRPPPPPCSPPTLPATPQDSRAPTFPAPARPRLPRSTAPLPPLPPRQAPRPSGLWPQESQAPTCRLRQGACRVALLITTHSPILKVQGARLKMDPISLKDPQRHRRGTLHLVFYECN